MPTQITVPYGNTAEARRRRCHGSARRPRANANIRSQSQRHHPPGGLDRHALNEARTLGICVDKALLATGPLQVGGWYMGIDYLALGGLLMLIGFDVLSMGVIAKLIVAVTPVRTGSWAKSTPPAGSRTRRCICGNSY